MIEEILPETAACAEAFADPPGVVLFSAKESVYKAWFPLTGRWLDFQDVDISIDAAGGTFGARPLTAAAQAAGVPLTGFAGRWLASGGLILTAVTLAAPPSAACAGPG